MDLQISNIFLTHEFHAGEENAGGSTDVIVEFQSGEKYIASFFTFDHVGAIREENLQSGNLMSGKYFWKKNMILVDELSKPNLRLIITHLLDIGDFRSIFEKI